MFFLLGAVATLVVGFTIFSVIGDKEKGPQECEECEAMQSIPTGNHSRAHNLDNIVVKSKADTQEKERRVGR